jgi:phosphohistidine swiveling domain-containing protein
MIYEFSYSPNSKQFSLFPISSNLKNKHIGNKAVSLIRLDELGYTIPKSLFLDYSFYEYYARNQKLPDELSRKIKKNFEIKSLAIRSSSNIEDGIRKSYAGFFLTQLNIVNDEYQIEKAIIECYQSIIRLKDFISRIEQNVKMGIIIQEMIAPVFSGIVFTVAPENAIDNQIQIDYCLGEGDKLTGGSKTAFTVQIDKSDYKIIKQTGTILLPQKLLIKLVSDSTTIERKLKFPQDIEFVIKEDNNEIYFVQSRNITAFNYTPDFIIKHETEKLNGIFETDNKIFNCLSILSPSNIAELFPKATPLGYSIFKHVFSGNDEHDGAHTLGRKALGYGVTSKDIMKNLYVTIGNKAYVNIPVQSLKYRLDQICIECYQEKYIPFYFNEIEKDKNKSIYPEFNLFIQNPGIDECNSMFAENGKKFFEYYSHFLETILNKTVPELQESIISVINKNDNYYHSQLKNFFENNDGTLIIKPNLTKKQLFDLLKENVEYLRTDFGIQYVIIARIAFLSAANLHGFLKNVISDFQEICPIKQDVLDHIEPNRQIEYYFNLLLANEPYHGKIEKTNIDNFNLDNWDELKDCYKLYRHVGPLDISQPRIGEYTIIDFKEKFNSLSTPKKEQATWEKQWIIEFRHWLHSNKNDLPLHFRNIELWLRYAKEFMEYREIMKYELLKIFYIIKLIVTELSKQYKIDDLIHFLTYNDIEKLYHKNLGRIMLEALKKKAYFNSCEQLEISKIVYKDNPQNIFLKEKKNVSNGSYRQIKGNTIHHGDAEGICLVAYTSDEFHNKITSYRRDGIEKVIGVFVSVDPAYLNIKELSGVITEYGGQLAHAATSCRENNVPYISGISPYSIKDGNYIIFDTMNQQIIFRD